MLCQRYVALRLALQSLITARDTEVDNYVASGFYRVGCTLAVTSEEMVHIRWSRKETDSSKVE